MQYSKLVDFCCKIRNDFDSNTLWITWKSHNMNIYVNKQQHKTSISWYIGQIGLLPIIMLLLSHYSSNISIRHIFQCKCILRIGNIIIIEYFNHDHSMNYKNLRNILKSVKHSITLYDAKFVPSFLKLILAGFLSIFWCMNPIRPLSNSFLRQCCCK